MKKWAGIAGVLFLLLIVPKVLGTYYVSLLTIVLIFGIFAMSLNLISGYMNLPSLGHAVFFGVAGYAIGILSKGGVHNFWFDFSVGIISSGLIAAMFGLIALRTRGDYFFMITLAFAQVLWGTAMSWRRFTGGDDGIPGIPRPNLGFFTWSMQDANHYFYLVLFFFTLALTLMYLIIHSPFGKIILGIRENELRMRALGYYTWLYKYICFIISGLLAGMAGGFSVYFNGFVSPSVFSIALSASCALMVLIGGSGTLIGPVIGAMSIVLLENIISGYTERWLFFMGVIYVVVVMFTPEGILGLIKKIKVKRGDID